MDNLKINIVGPRKYESLIEKQRQCNNYNFLNPDKEKMTLTDLELDQIRAYEAERGKGTLTDEERAHYMALVREGKKKYAETIQGVEINTKTIYKGFMEAFEKLNAKKYELTEDSILNIKAVVKYFAMDQEFFECERLLKKIDDRDLNPSFYKGILIIGDFGNGKSSIMQTFEYFINHNYKIALEQKWHNVNAWKWLRFKFRSCRAIASEYENLSKDDSKKAFLDRYSTFDYCFDDITKEQLASNFGIKNVVQVIFENRYDDIFKRIKEEKRINRTHGTLNYHKDHPGNLKLAIQALGVKYEAHMYDRVLQMFNIIEFKGKSFRN